jgi:hypothetical protein
LKKQIRKRSRWSKDTSQATFRRGANSKKFHQLIPPSGDLSVGETVSSDHIPPQTQDFQSELLLPEPGEQSKIIITFFN